MPSNAREIRHLRRAAQIMADAVFGKARRLTTWYVQDVTSMKKNHRKGAPKVGVMFYAEGHRSAPRGDRYFDAAGRDEVEATRKVCVQLFRKLQAEIRRLVKVETRMISGTRA